jgi:hypothetical protein
VVNALTAVAACRLSVTPNGCWSWIGRAGQIAPRAEPESRISPRTKYPGRRIPIVDTDGQIRRNDDGVFSRMKRFAIGFLMGLLGFVIANVVSHFAMSSPPGMMDGMKYYGFPFYFYFEGGLPTIEGFSVSFLLFDVFIAMVVGVTAGIYCRKRIPS